MQAVAKALGLRLELAEELVEREKDRLSLRYAERSLLALLFHEPLRNQLTGYLSAGKPAPFLAGIGIVDLRNGMKKDGLDLLQWGITGVRPQV